MKKQQLFISLFTYLFVLGSFLTPLFAQEKLLMTLEDGDLGLVWPSKQANTKKFNLIRHDISGSHDHAYKFSWRNDDGTPRKDAMYFISNGTVAFPALNGVAIGKTTPSARLDVAGNARFTPTVPANSSTFSVLIDRDQYNDGDFTIQNLNLLPIGNFSSFTRNARLGNSSHYWDYTYTKNIRMGSSLGGSKLLLYNNGSSSYGMGVTAGHFKFHIGNPQAKFAFYNSPQQNVEIFTIRGNGTFGLRDPNPSHTFSVNGSASKPGSGSWIVGSDRRLKKEIKKFELGLEIVEKVKPKTFKYNGKLNLPTETTYVGVIAQELQKVAPFMVSEFEKEGQKYLAVDPGAFDFILINAVKEIKQEKDEEITALEAEIQDLNTKIEKLIAVVNQLMTDKPLEIEAQKAIEKKLPTAELLQNQPNPFDKNTFIKYEVPEGTNKAELRIINANGQIIKQISITKNGVGEYNLNTYGLVAGIYYYSLILDGQIFQTKRMVLAIK